jgi:hypothetical protein
MKEIKAIEVFGTPYITQAEDVSIEQRGYWTRVSGKNVTIENYRGATNEEREEWQKELDAMQAERMQMFHNIKE